MNKNTKALLILSLVQEFVKDNNIICPETIYQTDRVIENAYEFIEKLADIAGYVENDE